MMSRLTQILRGKKIKPLTEMESAVKYAIDNAGGGGGSGLPDVTNADNGKVLKVAGGKWGKGDETSYAPLQLTGVIDSSGESATLTLDTTASAIYEAAINGISLIVSAEITDGATSVFVPWFSAAQTTSGSDVTYDIRLMLTNGTMLFGEDLAGTDTAVLEVVTD